MRRGRMTMAAASAVAALAVAGCGGGSAGGPVEFTDEPEDSLEVWGFENADDVGQSRLDHAAAQLDGVEIEIDAAAFDAQRFTAQAASGDLPDVVQMDRNFVATYAAQGLIVPLDECLALHDVDPEERWYPQVAADVTYDDQLWGVPQFYQPPLILLNERVVAEAGLDASAFDITDPDGLVAAVEQLTVLDGDTPTRLGFDPQGVSKAALWMLAMGGSIVDEDGVPSLDDPANVEAIELLQRLYNAQGGYAQVRSFVDAFDLFGDGNPYVTDQVAAAVFDQWYVNVLTPYADQVELGATPMLDADGEPFTAASGQAFVVPIGAEHPSAACRWMLDLTSEDAWMAAGAARAETTAAEPERNGINAGLFTGSPGADEAVRAEYVQPTDYPGFDATIQAYYDVAAEGVSFGATPAGQQLQSELQDAVISALLGEASPEDALADAQDAAMRAYEQVSGG
ncbi:ABC transporter substrate-binding protein [Agrococcus sp. SGAir0287]|uniref:ABC transporter substrate-binding protein n=1 Tax=Agrococcus sp. SGAir0287 TaxID=2070347 RepID=UPI0010CD0807|nr:extracellular solute-binding protein [Agrococcus sp. SGAir0287]QCR20132.1 sugar ABC transporter substrate-binding protein [Agrococcus sp. SGAir0287]